MESRAFLVDCLGLRRVCARRRRIQVPERLYSLFIHVGLYAPNYMPWSYHHGCCLYWMDLALPKKTTGTTLPTYREIEQIIKKNPSLNYRGFLMDESKGFKSWDDYFSYWEKKVQDLRKEMLSPDACGMILSTFHTGFGVLTVLCHCSEEKMTGYYLKYDR